MAHVALSITRPLGDDAGRAACGRHLPRRTGPSRRRSCSSPLRCRPRPRVSARGPGSSTSSSAGMRSGTGWSPENGYPSELPLSDTGDVVENAWAFMPVFAYAAKGIGFVLGSWGAGALVLSLVAGLPGLSRASSSASRASREHARHVGRGVLRRRADRRRCSRSAMPRPCSFCCCFLAPRCDDPAQVRLVVHPHPRDGLHPPGDPRLRPLSGPARCPALDPARTGSAPRTRDRAHPRSRRPRDRVRLRLAGDRGNRHVETPVRISRPNSRGVSIGSPAVSRGSSRSRGGSRRRSSGSRSGGCRSGGDPSYSPCWSSARLQRSCSSRRFGLSARIFGCGVRVTCCICSPSSFRSRAPSVCSCPSARSGVRSPCLDHASGASGCWPHVWSDNGSGSTTYMRSGARSGRCRDREARANCCSVTSRSGDTR